MKRVLVLKMEFFDFLIFETFVQGGIESIVVNRRRTVVDG